MTAVTVLKAAHDTLRRTLRRLPFNQQMRAWLMRLLPGVLRNPPLGFPPETMRPVPTRRDQDDCIIFAVIDWHYRFQRPQHLACELVSSGCRVFYVSSNLVADRRPGFRVEQLDEDGRIYQIFLNLKGATDVYSALPRGVQQSQLIGGVRALLSWADIHAAVVLVHHPFWTEVVGAIANVRLIYDCMDHHEGFGTFDQALLAAEHTLLARADLVVVSSAPLDVRVAPYTDSRVVIRNAADFTHFSTSSAPVFRDPGGRRIIGYYGAIASWLDLELIGAVARRFPDCLVRLIGRDQVAAKRRLGRLGNVELVGEVPYRDLPRYLHGFDVCILPFLINDLTLATNPVKVYEYLSAGKPVVAVALPELAEFGDLVATTADRASFLEAIAAALANPANPQTLQRRRAFAAQQTWAERGQRLIAALALIPAPRAPVAVTAGVCAAPSRRLALPGARRLLPRYFPRLGHVLRTEGPWALWRKIRRRLATTALTVPRKPRLSNLREPFPPVVFPRHEAPEVSVIIPVYNHFRITHHCLAALAQAGSSRSFEVIVVDDGSTDGTPRQLAAYPGVRLIENDRNIGFVGSCNRGALAARGAHLVFLNNDTQVQAGWLDALIETFDLRPDAGVVGGRLIYPDGRQQEAGGVVFRDGTAWNYGHLDDPYKPQYSYVREADYVSGAALAIRRELFEEVGRFDERYAPGYYEDLDLAFRVRAAGYRVYYQPLSRVVHVEGVSAGRDEDGEVGMKRFQAINRRKFLARWQPELASYGIRGEDLEKSKERRVARRVLVVDNYMLTPDRESGSLRMLNLLAILQDLGFKVTFAAANLEAPEPYLSNLQMRGVECLYRPYVKSVARHLKERGGLYDMVILSRADAAAKVMPSARQYCARAKIVFDTVDLHFLREERLAALRGDKATRGLAERRKCQELELVAQADATLVVSEVERKVLAAESPCADIHLVSNIHRIFGSAAPFGARRDILFIGAFAHPPNLDAVLWLAQAILPLIQAELPQLRCHVIGADPPARIRALAGDRLEIHGHVPDVRPYFDGCRLSVAPLRYGAGVKGKVNQSLAHGLPVVATSQAAEGMFLEDGKSVLLADDPRSFAASVLRLYRDEQLWNRLSREGTEIMERHFSFTAAKRALQQLIGE